MEVEDTRFGEGGVMFLADCGVIPDPDVDQLADIAVSTATLAHQLLGIRPRVALLSYSTKGSATHPSIGKVQAATARAQQKAHQKKLEADFDGEAEWGRSLDLTGTTPTFLPDVLRAVAKWAGQLAGADPTGFRPGRRSEARCGRTFRQRPSAARQQQVS